MAIEPVNGWKFDDRARMAESCPDGKTKVIGSSRSPACPSLVLDVDSLIGRSAEVTGGVRNGIMHRTGPRFSGRRECIVTAAASVRRQTDRSRAVFGDRVRRRIEPLPIHEVVTAPAAQVLGPGCAARPMSTVGRSNHPLARPQAFGVCAAQSGYRK